MHSVRYRRRRNGSRRRHLAHTFDIVVDNDSRAPFRFAVLDPLELSLELRQTEQEDDVEFDGIVTLATSPRLHNQVLRYTGCVGLHCAKCGKHI